MNDIRVAIVGAGFMGAAHTKAYSQIKDVKIAAVMDSDIDRAKKLAEAYGADAVTTLKDAIKLGIDAVDICLPTRFHKEAILQSFEAGLDVVCEKPISLLHTEAQYLANQARLLGRKLMVAHVVRFWPEYARLKAMHDCGALGNILQLTFSRYGAPPQWSKDGWMMSDELSGGILYDLTIHDIDFCLWMLGEPKWLFAKKSRRNQNYTVYANIIMGYETCNVLIESGFIMAEQYPFTVGFRLSNGDKSYEYINKNKQGLLLYDSSLAGKKLEYPDNDPYVEELRYFIDCVRNNKPLETCTAEEAANAVRFASLINVSAEENKVITI